MASTGLDLNAASPLARRLWWLIAGRAATAVLLLLSAIAWRSSVLAFGTINSKIAPLLLTVAGLSLIFVAVRLVWKNFLAQARLQILFDVLLVSWLVWNTGNVNSPYAALYIVIISVASLFLGPRGALITSIASAAAFNACALFAITRPGASSEAVANTIQTVGLSDISFLVVGLLAAKLAHSQTKSDVELAAATRSLADLRALHERIVES